MTKEETLQWLLRIAEAATNAIEQREPFYLERVMAALRSELAHNTGATE